MTEATDQRDLEDRIQDAFERLEGGFRRRWENNPGFRKSLKGKDRDILIDLKDEGAWNLQVRDGDLVDIVEGNLEDPDVRVIAEAEDFLAIFDGTLSPLEAYVKKKIKVKAGLRDILLVKSFMGG